MNLDTPGGRPSVSPPSSGRSSPTPRASRRTIEDGIYKADKSLRRYGATVERVLSSWEASPQEWADYIAFLGRLLKAIQNHPKDVPLLPHSAAVASKLAQCLNPALPSGVHQKSLEVYAYIFSTFSGAYLSGHLHEFLPGLSAVLSFASLSVRPNLYSLFEDYIVQLPPPDLRPVLKSLVLSLLPALEEETSEDFERAFRILETLGRTFSHQDRNDSANVDQAGYFWQCFFLAVITSPSRRQGSLNYLAHKLPNFAARKEEVGSGVTDVTNGTLGNLSTAAETVVSPEPGLLIRCFLCGLSDSQLLVQRGFLDLLVAKLPLNSPLLQYTIGKDDLDRLVSAAIHVLLRRDMSLNRRLWSWFLGPDPKANTIEDELHSSSFESKQSVDSRPEAQLKYFSAYGKAALERCVLAMFRHNTSKATERARPFRICLSLMDRWEIGGSIIPQMFLPAIESAYQYSLLASSDEVSEVLRSASLFFDGIEATLIWSNLLRLLRDTFSGENSKSAGVQLCYWTIQRFNIKDEEMLTIHIPYAAMYLLCLMDDEENMKIPVDKKVAAFDLAATLLEIVPERAFLPSTKEPLINDVRLPTMQDSKSVRDALNDFYEKSRDSSSKALRIESRNMAEFLYEFIISLMIKALMQELDEALAQAVSLLLILYSKAPKSDTLEQGGLFNVIFQTVEATKTGSRSLSFLTISSIMSLINTVGSDGHGQIVLTKSEIRKLESTLTAQLWQYLSPSLPKYHVEAVKLIWQLQDHIFPDDCLQASLNGLVHQEGSSRGSVDGDTAEGTRRFGVLWGHTIPAAASSTKHGLPSLGRRESSMSSISHTKQLYYRQRIMTEPLMLVLDSLSDHNSRAFEVVKCWLHGLPTLENVFNIHFDIITKLISYQRELLKSNDTSRHRAEKIRHLEYIIGHFLTILSNGNDWTWQCLGRMSLLAPHETKEMTGVVLLTDLCTQFLCSDDLSSPELHGKSIELLEMLLSSPASTSLKILDLDTRFLDRLMEWLSRGEADLQGPLLILVTKALRLRLVNEPADTNGDAHHTRSTGTKRPSAAGTSLSPNASSTALAATPPPQLLGCLRMGFASHTARSHLDQWLAFLTGILPVFEDTIFASLMPLVECFCTELDKTHSKLISLSKLSGSCTTDAPEPTAMALLEGLEMVLARAHECLIDDHNPEPSPKATVQSRSLLGNVASGVFKVDGPPSRTSQSNSRLTVILTLQDAIRISLKLWIWGSHCTDVENFDKSSAATTSYNAQKIRNRTRHMLEQIFSVEPLESLEVVISNWCYMPDSNQALPAIDLLHVMQGSRPKNVVPAILDALCSRTNPVPLPPHRQSSQTINLGALDVALFLSAYLKSTEDDAMDEVWSDCVGFLRDVLSNPLPYRQVLPALLAIIVLLAQKVENTNFGEQKKMRRDLGDIFLRLLGATFTTMPAGFVQEAGTVQQEQIVAEHSNSAMGQRDMGLAIVLKDVMANAEVVLETSDRATTAVNSISSNLISPLFHARTFPANITANVLALLLQMAKKAPAAKSWKKELLDAFNDARLLTSSTKLMEDHWAPLFAYWCIHDKERMPELLTRLAPPSSAGIMFGVGASAARLEADRKTQLNLRRICLLLLASPGDAFVIQSRIIAEKLVELFEASPSSSPSSAVKPELFMLCRTIALSTSNVHLAPLWPIINDSLQSALTYMLPTSVDDKAFGNLSLLQACKLLDLLVILSPDEFQLHEWLYITDTIDAVYGPPEWSSSALSDQVAEALASDAVEDEGSLVPPTPTSSVVSGRLRPLIDNESVPDTEDLKAMARDDFARTVLRPFLSQLSIHAYEGVYSMEVPDLSSCRRGLFEDLLDLSTIVE